jgi:hypothetical protein
MGVPTGHDGGVDAYWYHLGEALAICQMLGHTDLPDFVGDIDSLAPYIPE